VSQYSVIFCPYPASLPLAFGIGLEYNVDRKRAVLGGFAMIGSAEQREWKRQMRVGAETQEQIRHIFKSTITENEMAMGRL
jgi:hypothetical protein